MLTAHYRRLYATCAGGFDATAPPREWCACACRALRGFYGRTRWERVRANAPGCRAFRGFYSSTRWERVRANAPARYSTFAHDDAGSTVPVGLDKKRVRCGGPNRGLVLIAKSHLRLSVGLCSAFFNNMFNMGKKGVFVVAQVVLAAFVVCAGSNLPVIFTWHAVFERACLYMTALHVPALLKQAKRVAHRVAVYVRTLRKYLCTYRTFA